MLDSGTIKGILENEIDNAIGYLDTETTEARQKALEYYLRNHFQYLLDIRSKIRWFHR